MKLQKIDTIYNGKYIHLHNAHYINNDNEEKIYEFISRNQINNIEDISNNKSNAVTLIIFNKTKDKILLLKEYRMAIGKVAINFPAGLIDDGENATEAAIRELKEETGLDLIEFIDILKPSYSAVGITNEKVTTIIGIADGNIVNSTFANEEIEANWYTKEDIKNLFNQYDFAARTQMFLYMWCQT